METKIPLCNVTIFWLSFLSGMSMFLFWSHPAGTKLRWNIRSSYVFFFHDPRSNLCGILFYAVLWICLSISVCSLCLQVLTLNFNLCKVEKCSYLVDVDTSFETSTLTFRQHPHWSPWDLDLDPVTPRWVPFPLHLERVLIFDKHILFTVGNAIKLIQKILF